MKAAFIVVFLTVSLRSNAALDCNRCVPAAVGGHCHNTVETCGRPDEVCASVVCTLPKYHVFKRCMRSSNAVIMESLDFCSVFTCTRDRCN